MQEKTEQHLDKLVKKAIQLPPLQSPSVEFTASVMDQIKELPMAKSFVYKPLISIYGWIAIATCFIGLFVFVGFGNVSSMSLLEYVDYAVLFDNEIISALSNITKSKTVMYAVGFFGLLFLVQIPLMKHYLNKRLEF